MSLLSVLLSFDKLKMLQATTSSGAPEQVLIRKIIELHDKYMAYVTDCFSNNTLFHQALKEAYEVFCNKTVAGSSTAELLATFCDDTPKKGGSEKLGDEAIKETLEKVVKLLMYISDKDPFAEFYWKKLAWRLLFYCSANDDHERSIPTKLKQQCEGQFASKMEGMVLPSLAEKDDEFMLRELVKRWSNHKVMVWWLSRFFHYLDRYFIAQRSLPALNEVGLTCFRDLVYKEIKGKVRDAVIILIDKEREGEPIDRALLKNVLDIFVKIGMGHMERYEKDFEEPMLNATSEYYSRKASSWILEDSCLDYMLKATLSSYALVGL
ncbi:hypothetical protein SLEP1_g1250 [Rubroshorea leprosula]|uniref:Cullin family profile domain-containing protein n=1 Tax=Rubroshorea leprosula TaxID=152421 RepID=A0AAV5HP39_9ROSI|nr:hypothetical protein SLEP1_g1250 [Rubroshorea leprosula]